MIIQPLEEADAKDAEVAARLIAEHDATKQVAGFCLGKVCEHSDFPNPMQYTNY